MTAVSATGTIKVSHVITGLPVGGAQTMLTNLIHHLDPLGFTSEVISLTELGTVGDELLDTGISVRALEMNRSFPNPTNLIRLTRFLRAGAPHIVQTWMYHADLLGGICAKIIRTPCVWNIRQSNFSRKHTPRMTMWTAEACARLSNRLPEVIICNSRTAATLHTDLGYRADRLTVIPNGIDATVFRPDLDAYLDVRRELGIGEKQILIGLFGRHHAQKDHSTFLEAAAGLANAFANVHFLLCGEDITPDKNPFQIWLRNHPEIADRFYLLGLRRDMPRLTASLDIACSSSAFGEGFSNTIVEAMACGVPCVVTNVGDSAEIVGDSGKVSPPSDVDSLGRAMRDLVIATEERKKLGASARSRVKTFFSIEAIGTRYAHLYEDLSSNSSSKKFVTP